MIVPRLQTMVFLGAAVPVAAIGLAVLVAGWVLVTCLAITPLVVPALVAFRAATGGAAWLDGQLANELLDTSVQPPVTSPGPGGFWRSGLNVLGDGAFWRQQAYLMIRLSLGFALGIAAWAVLAAGLGLLTLPAWYRFDNVLVLGRFVDTIGRALLGVPAGLASARRPLSHPGAAQARLAGDRRLAADRLAPSRRRVAGGGCGGGAGAG